MESEFIDLELVGSEAEWSRNLLSNISLGIKPTSQVLLHCESKIAAAKNKSFNGKNIHIQLSHNIVKHLLKGGTISINYVKSEVNLADPLTKPLGRKVICDTSRGIRLKLIEINK